MTLFDVIIVGGGPAGLNAAIVLGRCRRKVILFDNGHQRNILSNGIHNYLTRDGIKPPDFLQMARQETSKYGILIKNLEIRAARKHENGSFAITDEKGAVYFSKKILLATGLSDILPVIEGINELYGRSVFHCPYCDGWEVRDKKLAVYARNKNGFELALSLFTWSRSITLYTDGKNKLKPAEMEYLARYRIPVVTTRITRLHGTNGKIKSIELKDTTRHPCDGLFFANGYTQQCDIAEHLGCFINRKKVIITNRLQQTNVAGVYVAGDASRDMQFVVVAAAEGAKAGVTINKQLQKEEKENIKTKKNDAFKKIIL